jgi:hypothetical protein
MNPWSFSALCAATVLLCSSIFWDPEILRIFWTDVALILLSALFAGMVFPNHVLPILAMAIQQSLDKAE